MQRNDLNILYSCHFNIEILSGKSRATNQKLKALKKYCKNLKINCPKSIKKPLVVFEVLFIIELKNIFFLFLNKPQVFISRGYTGILSTLIAKFLGILVVREIHAHEIEEIELSNENFLKKKIRLLFAFYSHRVDIFSNLRIFNHPALASFYRARFSTPDTDFYSYNGYDKDSLSSNSKNDARKTFGLKETCKYIVFTGAASIWHGVHYLVPIQEELNKLTNDIKIICGGGSIDKNIDPNKLLSSFSPLNAKGCADLISASDLTILPVNNIRVSPGSPLKMYDYFLAKKVVICPSKIDGYFDECSKYGKYIEIDFSQPRLAAEKIISGINNKLTLSNYDQFSWDYRMKCWIDNIASRLDN
jgi:hypothetical protein